MSDSAGATGQLTREDVKMRAGDRGPILEVAGLEIELRVSYRGPADGFDSEGEGVTTELDSNPDFPWFNVYRDDGLTDVVEIVPQVVSDE